MASCLATHVAPVGERTILLWAPEGPWPQIPLPTPVPYKGAAATAAAAAQHTPGHSPRGGRGSSTYQSKSTTVPTRQQSRNYFCVFSSAFEPGTLLFLFFLCRLRLPSHHRHFLLLQGSLWGLFRRFIIRQLPPPLLLSSPASRYGEVVHRTSIIMAYSRYEGSRVYVAGGLVCKCCGLFKRLCC